MNPIAWTVAAATTTVTGTVNPGPVVMVPRPSVMHLTSVAATLLAISVGIFAFVPLIIDIAINRSADPNVARRRAKRAHSAFDILLAAVFALGLSVGCGLLLLYTTIHPIYVAEAVLLAGGLAGLMLGTLVLGWTLRALRGR